MGVLAAPVPGRLPRNIIYGLLAYDTFVVITTH